MSVGADEDGGGRRMATRPGSEKLHRNDNNISPWRAYDRDVLGAGLLFPPMLCQAHVRSRALPPASVVNTQHLAPGVEPTGIYAWQALRVATRNIV